MLFERKKPVVLVDIDDTVADTRKAVYDIYVEATGDKTGDINTKSKRYADFCKKWTDENIEALFKNGYTVYEKALPMPGAIEGIQALEARGYDVRFVTMHAIGGADAKQRWIKKYFPHIEHKVYYVDYRMKNKDVFKEYAIIDDDFKNIKTNSSAKPILIDFYNIYSDLYGYIKCRNWNEVLTKI